MSNVPARYRPERPIGLNEQNTNASTRAIAIYNIERLRSAGWLCCYSETLRPLHLSFDNPDEYQEFKRDCSKLKIILKSPVITSPVAEFQDIAIVQPEPNATYEDVLGKIHTE